MAKEVKTYGRQKFRMVSSDVKKPFSFNNFQSRNIFNDCASDESPVDPFDKLLKKGPVYLPRIRLLEDEENDSTKTTINNKCGLWHNISKTKPTKKKKVKKVKRRSSIELKPYVTGLPLSKNAIYADYSAIETSELVVEKDFTPKSVIRQNRRKQTGTVAETTLLPRADLDASTKTLVRKKHKSFNWTDDSLSVVKKNAVTTSTPMHDPNASDCRFNLVLEQSAIPKHISAEPSPCLTQIGMESSSSSQRTAMSDYRLKLRTRSSSSSSCGGSTIQKSRQLSTSTWTKDMLLDNLCVRLHRLPSFTTKENVPLLEMALTHNYGESFNRNSSNHNDKSHQNVLEHSRSCEDQDRNSVKATVRTRTIGERPGSLVSMLTKRSHSMANDPELSQKCNKLPKLSSSKQNRSGYVSFRQCGNTSLLVSLTPLDFSTHGVTVCGLQNILLHCKQGKPTSFLQYISDMSNIRKIGEGSYGEIYRAVDGEGNVIVIKIQAIYDEMLEKFGCVWPEIVSSCRLSELEKLSDNMTTTFVRVNNTICLQGCYPKILLQAWDLYDNVSPSENDRPSFYDAKQTYIAYEIMDGGVDLEKYELKNYSEAFSIFLQVACALAVAENELKFEHRDLHWGNVLVKNTNESHVTFTIRGKTLNVPTHDVKVTIIDFSFSRLEEDECVVYNDLAKDESIFSGTGDYQFDIYRLMRDHTSNDWHGFYPFTNVLWLHYLADKLVNVKTYKTRRRFHRHVFEQLTTWHNQLLSCQSADAFVTANCKYFS